VTTPANLRPARPRDDLPGVARLLTLSDNVVAIALTLLLFQLKVPATALVADPGSAADLAAQLAKQADQLIGYLVAFYVVAQFWLAHHRVFRRVSGHHEGLAWWNFAFLFTITAMPFTSSLLGSYGVGGHLSSPGLAYWVSVCPVYITGLRPNPTRHARAGWCLRAGGLWLAGAPAGGSRQFTM